MRTCHEVLVIDDNAADVLLIEAGLRTCGFNGGITTAKDGNAGLAIISKRNTKPDLILLDLNMPVLDGHGVLKHLRNSSDKRTRDLRVVVMSSSKLPADIDRAYELGANAYMTKPVDYIGLVQALGAVLQSFLGTAS